MKSRKIFKSLGAFATASVAFVSSIFICQAYKNNQINVVKTTNVSANDAESYFADIEKNIGSYTRESLYEALHSKINDGWKKISYGELASHIVNVDFDDSGYLNDIYSNKHSVKAGSSGCSPEEGNTWNKEHFIPKSWWGGNTSGNYGEGGDMFNMYATDSHVNSIRSNYPLGEVSQVVDASNESFSKLGYSSELSDIYVFEINDKFKALAAHSYFYFACKNDVMNRSPDTYTLGNGHYTFDKNGTFGLTSYATNLFLKWNKDRSNIQFEKDRAEKVYKEQNNLNPFIYHPEWADFIWGGIPLSVSSSQSSLLDTKDSDQVIENSLKYSFVFKNSYRTIY